jgi:predicted phage terminase large subunit-like protein
MKIGFAKVDITPRIGMELYGYSGYLNRYATAVRDKLWARSMAVSDGKQVAVVVSCEIVFITRELTEEVRRLVLQELKRDKHEKVKFVAYRPKGDKVQRLSTVTPVMEEGLVFMPANAPWLRALLEELLVFPAGSYDDQVDSISQFLNWHRNGPKLCVRHLKGL